MHVVLRSLHLINLSVLLPGPYLADDKVSRFNVVLDDRKQPVLGSNDTPRFPYIEIVNLSYLPGAKKPDWHCAVNILQPEAKGREARATSEKFS